jgi:hypothetical protein
LFCPNTIKAWNYILEAIFQCEGDSISLQEQQNLSTIQQPIHSQFNEMQDLKFEQIETEWFCLVWHDEPSEGCMVRETPIWEHLQKEGA